MTWAGDLTTMVNGKKTMALVALATCTLVLLTSACTPLPAAQTEPGTVAPRETPSLEPTTFTPTAADFQSEERSRQEILGTVVALQEPALVETLTSPDLLWQAEVYAADCIEIAEGETYAVQELRLASKESGTAQVVDSQLISCGGLGAYGLAGRFWSENSRYFYYTDAATGVPDGCGWWSPPFLRVDTADMTVETIGEGSLSPDGSFLAAWQGDRLGLWRVDGERLVLAEIPTVVRLPGPIAWRPDGSAIAFLITEGHCPLGETDLGRLDLADLRPIIILSYRDPSFAGVVWDAPNRVTLTDEQGRVWRYNFLTRDLWQVEP